MKEPDDPRRIGGVPVRTPGQADAPAELCRPGFVPEVADQTPTVGFWGGLLAALAAPFARRGRPAGRFCVVERWAGGRWYVRSCWMTRAEAEARLAQAAEADRRVPPPATAPQYAVRWMPEADAYPGKNLPS